MYKVRVTRSKGVLRVFVDPPPEFLESVDDKDSEKVSNSIKDLILEYSNKPIGVTTPYKLRKELTELLNKYTNQGMIRPSRHNKND